MQTPPGSRRRFWPHSSSFSLRHNGELVAGRSCRRPRFPLSPLPDIGEHRKFAPAPPVNRDDRSFHLDMVSSPMYIDMLNHREVVGVSTVEADVYRALIGGLESVLDLDGNLNLDTPSDGSGRIDRHDSDQVFLFRGLRL